MLRGCDPWFHLLKKSLIWKYEIRHSVSTKRRGYCSIFKVKSPWTSGPVVKNHFTLVPSPHMVGAYNHAKV